MPKGITTTESDNSAKTAVPNSPDTTDKSENTGKTSEKRGDKSIKRVAVKKEKTTPEGEKVQVEASGDVYEIDSSARSVAKSANGSTCPVPEVLFELSAAKLKKKVENDNKVSSDAKDDGTTS